MRRGETAAFANVGMTSSEVLETGCALVIKRCKAANPPGIKTDKMSVCVAYLGQTKNCSSLPVWERQFDENDPGLNDHPSFSTSPCAVSLYAKLLSFLTQTAHKSRHARALSVAYGVYPWHPDAWGGSLKHSALMSTFTV